MKNLVEYSSSEESDEEEEKRLEETTIKKLPMLLPVKETEKTSIKECPENHQMRSRSFEHVEGNWATHVYIDCPLNENLCQAMKILVESFNGLHMMEAPHASLSKTFVLKFHWINNFVASLREKFRCSSSKFLLQLSPDIVYFTNEEKTRHFTCILACDWCNPILALLIEKVDLCLKEFNLPLYYENPSVHVSVLWKLSEFTEEEKSQISLAVNKLMEEHKEVLNVWVEKISVKSGNKLIEIQI